MEQPPKLDQLFRERLHDAETPPPAFVWPRVEEELRRRRRRFFLWCWFGLGLAGAGLWGLWPMQASSITALVTTPKLEEIQSSDLTSQNKFNEENNHSTEQPIASFSTTNKPNPPATNQAQNKVEVRQSINSKTPGSHAGNLKFTPKQPDASVLSVTPLAMVFAGEESVPHLNSTIENQLLISGVAHLNNSAASLTFLPGRERNLALLPIGQNLVLPKAKPFFFKKKKPFKNCYDFAKHPQVWLLDAYVGPSLPQRQLTTAQNEFDHYLQQRRNTESSSLAFNAGLRGSLLFGQHFLVRTGAHYEQMTEVFEYIDPNFIRVNTTQTSTYIDGMWKTITDTTGIDYGENYVKTFNRYGRLDIPIMAGAEFRAGRAGVSLQAGASLNVWFWKRGTILGAQGTPESFTPGQRHSVPVFRQHAGWSATASAQMFYHLRPRLRVFAEPYYSHSFRPLTLADQPIAQRYTTWGLKLGVTQIFD